MQALNRQQVMDVIEGRGGAPRVPLNYHMWVSPSRFGEEEAQFRAALEQCPCDIQMIPAAIPDVFEAPADDKSYRWVQKENRYEGTSVGLDSQVAIEDWEELPGVLENFPSPEYPGLFGDSPAPDGRYRLVHWWYWMFERMWSLRGMENALTDFYEYPEEVHALFERLTDFYCRVLERAKAEQNADGVMISDDIGTQTSPFFSPEIFREFFKPYYRRLIEKAHSLGMHVWLHSCGNIELFIPEFIEIGLDVLHPIQKYTMEERKIAERFGNQICIFAGFDVQQAIPYGTPEEVRQELRFMIDTYARPDGRLMLTFGNNLTPDCPLESFRVLLEEAVRYGSEKCAGFLQKIN